MKKRKILVSLALASACLFSLAACGKTEEPTPTPTATATTTTTTTTTNDSLAVTFKARYSDGTPEEELTALAKSVKSGEKVAKPADPAKDGYNFLGFETANGAAFNFDNAITAATTVYAYFDKVTAYHTFVQGENVIEQNNFNDTNADTDVDDLNGFTNTSMEGGSVVFQEKKMKVISAAKTASGTKQDGQATYAPDEPITNSIIKGTFAFNVSVVDKYYFIDFLGDSKFQLGTRKIKNADDVEIFVLRFTSGSETVLDFEIEAGKEYTVEFEINQLTGKMNLTIDGEETLIKDLNVASYFTTFKGIAFGSTKGAAIDVYVDNFAISSEYGDIDDVKAAGKSALSSKLTSLASTDNISKVTSSISVSDSDWETVSSEKTDGDAAIEAATTSAEADAAYKSAVTAMNEKLDALRTKYIGLVNTELAAVTLAGYEKFATDYAAMSDDEKTAADAALATIKAKYTTAETGEIAKCKNIKAIKSAVESFYSEVDKIFAIEVTYKYYTAASTEVASSSQKGLILKEGTPTVADVTALAGYKALGIYTDETLTTEYTSKVSSSVTIYVKVVACVSAIPADFDATTKKTANGFELVTSDAAKLSVTNTYIDFGGNGNTSDKHIKFELEAGTWEVTIIGYSNSDGNAAGLELVAGTDGTPAAVAFSNTSRVGSVITPETVKINVTLTSKTTMYLYRKVSKSARVTLIEAIKK